MIALADDGMCFVCGKQNPDGLKLNFSIDEHKTIHTEYTFPKKYQGYADIVHGGMMAVVLDEVMVNLPWRLEKAPVVSAEFSIRLKKPVKVGEKILFKGWIVKHLRRYYEMESEAATQEGMVVATAKAKCFRMEIRERDKGQE